MRVGFASLAVETWSLDASWSSWLVCRILMYFVIFVLAVPLRNVKFF